MTDLIGSWVSRVQAGTLETLGTVHRCESVINDEPVTRCGRRLRTLAGSVFAYTFEEPLVACRKCRP